jgi:hypothetical protein
MHFKCNLLSIYWNENIFISICGETGNTFYVQYDFTIRHVLSILLNKGYFWNTCYDTTSKVDYYAVLHFLSWVENFFLCNVAFWCIFFLRVWRLIMWKVDLSMYTTAYCIAVSTLIQLCATHGGVWSLVEVSHTCHYMLWTKHKCSVCSH